MREIHLDQIKEWQNYRKHNLDRVRGLADDMQEHGYRPAFPIEVCPGDDCYFIITGHGRYAAATLAGLSAVWAVVHDDIAPGSPEFLAMQLRENMAREESNPLEDGQAFTIQVSNGRTVEDIARDISRSVGYVRDRIDAASLDPVAQVLAVTPGAGLRYCTALVGLPGDLQASLANKLLADPKRMGLEAWREFVASARSAYEETLHVGMFDMASQEWDTALGAYVDEATALVESARVVTVREEMLGVDELAAHLGIARAAILKRLQRGTLAPDFRFGNLPGWYASTVAEMPTSRTYATAGRKRP